MAYLDPTAIKAAITNGAVWKPGDRLYLAGVLHTLASNGTAWSLSTDAPSTVQGAERYKMTKIVVQKIRDGVVLEDFRIQSGGVWQLAPGVVEPQLGYASLLDP